MSPLISVHQIDKTFGDKKLFSQLSFGIHEKQRLGLLGPNGSGKSTLMKILAGTETADSGEVSPRKSLNLAYVPQEDSFPTKERIIDVATNELIAHGTDKEEAFIQATIHLSMVGFTDTESLVEKLSGGWRKRLSLAIAFAKEPDLLLLDEPTNHLDWEGILWLEGQLKTYKNAFFLISHDRDFLSNQCRQFIEINRAYKGGYISLECSFSDFLEKKEDYIKAQLSLQESMSNKARREIDWLRAGVKARTTKSSARIKEAHQLVDELGELKARNASVKAKIKIGIESGGKRSKKLIEAKDLNISYGEHLVLKDFNAILGPKTCLGVMGDNASGKTSLLKVLAQQSNNFEGHLFHAEDLKIVYFDQKREDLNPDENIMEFLGDGADHVTFQDRSLHVASYASHFLFSSEKLHLPIHRLSGGEQARLLIAKLLLQPADVLILDEPTNDLDIDTIEILESALLEFNGLIILVSHDRYFLRSVCNNFLGLDGKTNWTFYSEVDQWLKDRKNDETQIVEEIVTKKKQPNKKVKLSYKEKRALETIEDDIAQAEADLATAQEAVESNTDFTNHEKTQALISELNLKQSQVDELYQLWQSIEEKQKTNT